MNNQSQENELPSAKRIQIDWADSEWFQVWLKLARRDYQGDPRDRQTRPEPELVAAA